MLIGGVVMTATASLPELHPFSGAPDSLPGQEVDGRAAPVQSQRLRLLLCPPPEGLDPVQAVFAQAIADQLHGVTEVYSGATSSGLAKAALPYDLVLLGEKRPSWWQLILGDLGGRQAARQIDTSILLMRRPRWPLRHILLICRAEASDELTLPWVAQLAGGFGTAVTLLVVVPCIPALCRQPGPYPIGLQTLLHPHTTSGQRVRYLLQRLLAAGIQARIHLRDGEPDEQIRQEAATAFYDMIVIAGEGDGRLRHAVLGELITPMLAWLNTPLLLVRNPPPITLPRQSEMQTP